MNGRKPDRREIKITKMGGRILDTGILEEEVTDAYLGDSQKDGDIFITRKLKGQPDCPHKWVEPYVVCDNCGRSLCKHCFYQGSIRQCIEGHYTCGLCWRKSWFSREPLCGICRSPLLLPPTPNNGDRTPERSLRLPVPLWIMIPSACAILFLLPPGWVLLLLGFFVLIYIPEIARFGLGIVKRRLLGESKNH